MNSLRLRIQGSVPEATVLAALLIAWEVIPRVGILDPRFFPPLTRVVVELVNVAVDGTLLSALTATIIRITIAFVAAATLGTLLGILAGRFAIVNAIVQPFISTFFPLPNIALLPLLIIIFGFTEVTIFAAVALASFFQVLMNVRDATRDLDESLLEAAQLLDARGLTLLTQVYIPAALPYILSAYRIAMGITMSVTIAVEFLMARSGIGYMVSASWHTLSVDRMFVGLLVAAVLAHLINLGMRGVELGMLLWSRSAT